MKALLIFLISSTVYSNTFELKETNSRFQLSITPVRLIYSSEIMSHDVRLGNCGLSLARELNEELLNAVKARKTHYDFYIDGKKLRAPASAVTLMDAKIMSFLLKERSLCQ